MLKTGQEKAQNKTRRSDKTAQNKTRRSATTPALKMPCPWHFPSLRLSLVSSLVVTLKTKNIG